VELRGLEPLTPSLRTGGERSLKVLTEARRLEKVDSARSGSLRLLYFAAVLFGLSKAARIEDVGRVTTRTPRMRSPGERPVAWQGPVATGH
jgi:hypothetical protein